MIRSAFYLSVFAVAMILSGCQAVGSSFSNDAPQLVAAPDKVSAMLAEAADRASRSLETLAAVEHSRTPNAELTPITQVPTELRRAITVNWVGPVEPITKTLADRASYEFLTIGTAPPVPIVVSIDVENMSVVDVLRDIGLQLGMRGDVKVDARRKIVEIHYPPNTGIGAHLQ